MSNDKHYPTHPGAEHPPTMTCEIPLEEYESLKREIERLNRELEHVKNGDCIYTCDVVEKHVKEELKEKRALWMARADRAKAIKWHEGLERYLQERKKYWPSRFSFMKDDEMYHVWYKCWCDVERKCRAKTEQYK